MKILVCNFNNVLTDVIEGLKQRGHEVLPEDGKTKTWKRADVVVVWNETALAGWRDWIEMLKRRGKRVVLVQHGRRGTSRIYPPFNETLISDAVCVWGENDRNRLISVGVDPAKIHVTGTTIWKHLTPRVPHEGKNVVFSPEHWDVDVAENLVIASELRKLRGVNVITKTLRGHQMEVMYDNVVSSDRNSPEHFRVVADVLSKADAVVAVSESTFELLAESLDIPVIIPDIWVPKACDGDGRYKEYKREYSSGCSLVPLKELNKEIYRSLKHPESKRRERIEAVEGDGGKSLPDPVASIINVIIQ